MNLPKERWDEVKDLFGEALDAPPEERARLLLEHAHRDAALVREVMSLLAAHDGMGDRFGRPAQAILSDAGALDGLEAAASLEGQRLGAFVVGRKIGEGGMGAVYEAVRADDEYRHRVAIKTISRGADSGAIVRRFRRERQILAGLQHPNIAALFDGGVSESGTPYLVMEYVEGLPIDAWCARHRLSIAQRLDLFRQACAAVQHAHRRLVVHRDIKPGNVMVSADGVVKLLDFGIAKLVDAGGEDAGLTDSGLTPLTTAYASPEQARGETVSTATDVYSLGVVLYQLLAGTPPFSAEGKTRAQVLTAVTEEIPAAPSLACTEAAALGCGMERRERLAATLSGELDAIVLMALRKEPDRRYPSVDALSDDVHRYLKGLPVSARPDTAGYRVRKFIGRRRGLVIAASLTVLAVVAGSGVALWQSRLAGIEAGRTKRIADFLQSLLGAADATTEAGSLPHIGPRASVSALLDSALRRVPAQFPDDPAVRGRLYATIGTGFMTESRLREASAVFDSAIRLSALTEGTGSQSFAFANLEAAEAAIHSNRVTDAHRFALDARAALERGHWTGTELYSRVFHTLATVAQVENDYPALDSLARRALALENRRLPGPSLEKAGALNRLAVYEVSRDHLARADSMALHANAMLDSLGMGTSLDRIDVLGNLVDLSIMMKQIARADSFAHAGAVEAEQVFGPDSREMALFQSHLSVVSLLRGDTAQSRAYNERAVRILDSIPIVIWPIRYLIHGNFAGYLYRSGNYSAADSMYRRIIGELAGIRTGLSAVEAHMMYGITRSQLRDFPAGEEHLKLAQRFYDESGINSAGTAMNIHYFLARLYAREGKSAEAESLFATLTPAQVASIKAFVVKDRAAPAPSAVGASRARRRPTPSRPESPR